MPDCPLREVEKRADAFDVEKNGQIPQRVRWRGDSLQLACGVRLSELVSDRIVEPCACNPVSATVRIRGNRTLPDAAPDDCWADVESQRRFIGGGGGLIWS